MSFKSSLIRPFARKVAWNIRQRAQTAVEDQDHTFRRLISRAADTEFGRRHGFSGIGSVADFRERCPIRDYEGLKPYVAMILEGRRDVLWPGKPKYFAKTSGTTSGIKYIPVTRESVPNHINTARNALFNHCSRVNDFSIFDGKMIFLSGSPELEDTAGIPTGRLSGIVNHMVPGWIRGNQLPTYRTNCIEDWEEKLERIVGETIDSDMRLISGIPPWVKMYYERLLERSGKDSVRELFPNFSVFVYGGVNFEPYRAGLEELTGGPVAGIETYPASEGFIAFQDEQGDPGMLLNTRSGIFFEFVPADQIFDDQPTRLTIGQVETGQNYALILSNNAGLWAYNLGDTVEFTSLHPFRLRVTGRIKHFISAFGEHVIGKEVETAILDAVASTGLDVVECTVAPRFGAEGEGPPYHEWYVEFADPQADPAPFAQALDDSLQRQNIYYRDLISGGILRPAVVRPIQKHGFREYMKSRGKLGGQNKVPRLSNDREIADSLGPFLVE